jgi:hypothetical protein
MAQPNSSPEKPASGAQSHSEESTQRRIARVLVHVNGLGSVPCSATGWNLPRLSQRRVHDAKEPPVLC